MSDDPDTVAVLGADGYTGWTLTTHLLEQGYGVIGVDNLSRRERAAPSVTPIASIRERSDVVRDQFPGRFQFRERDATEFDAVMTVLTGGDPDAIVNLAQIPSAPFSMQDLYSAWEVKHNNVRSTLNLLWGLKEANMTDTPVVQLATMGEYPLGNDIPEGFLDDGRPAPKDGGSYYHNSKIQMTTDTYFAAKTWGIPVTEIYQGIVYGLPSVDDERLLTRFDVDPVWGTVLNRFTAQAAAGEPLTVYGAGGQKRAMLSIDDCIQCLTLALENPPSPDGPGEYPYRAINQFDGCYRVRELAEMVAETAGAEIEHVDNPRVEDDSDHDYDPEREVLDALGYKPKTPLPAVFDRTYEVVDEFSHRIEADLRPNVEWS